jgi:NADPH:quinone reductase-like Zn-dependent oxidoreductase|uniref:Enoyl reductase (ER) domain-containing protein n=1 Tax=Globisporangium ultimum (strain ATCC 200006 / CBS 805.95 / DAOM BR144) TaxID=431595 RepID=K3WX96_GLOUD
MRAVHVTAFTARGNVAFVDDARAPQLQPDSSDLLVRVLACALNPGDCRLLSGSVSLVMTPRAFPYVPGSDVCGVVVAIGTKCTHFKVGDRIVASLPPFVHGSFADLVLVDANLAAMAPSVCSALEAASLPVAGCTALQAIKDARIGPGSRVLVIGGSGGVGTLVIQLAKLKGAAFVATTSTNAALVKSLGADLVIDYRHANWWDALQQQQEALLDVVIDCVGDAASWQHCDRRVVHKNGRYIAVVDSPNTEVRTIWDLLAFLGPMLWRSLNPFTTSYKMVSSFPQGKHVQELVDLVTANPEKLRAVLDPASPFAFTLEGVTQAVALQNSHRAKGKLVFEVNSE